MNYVNYFDFAVTYLTLSVIILTSKGLNDTIIVTYFIFYVTGKENDMSKNKKILLYRIDEQAKNVIFVVTEDNESVWRNISGDAYSVISFDDIFRDITEFRNGFLDYEQLTGELIGAGGMIYHEDKGVWSVGYNLAYDYWHNGYTPEAIKRIIEYAQSKYDVHVIAGTFAIGNEGSRRVMEKLGMSFYEDTEYTKLDGSETFKAKTFHKVF